MGDDKLTSTTTATMARTAAAPANMRMTTAGNHGADAGNDVDGDDVHPSMKHVIAMLVTRSMRKSARIEGQEVCQTDDARAAVRACGPRGIFCKGFVPWAHDKSIASAPRGGMKSVGLAEFIRILWFLYDFRMSARRGNLKSFC